MTKTLKTFNTADKVLLKGPLKHYIDINTDYGQSQDKTFFQNENETLLDYVSSVNIPCCVHDGNPLEVKQLIANAKAHHCVVGAHIAYPDPVNYGYTVMDISNEELAAWIQVQIGAFTSLLKTEELELAHVRPHGALYGLFLTDYEKAKQVAQTLFDMNPWLFLIAPAGPILQRISEEVGIKAAPEIYLGKRYNAEGLLLEEQFHENLNTQGLLDQAKQLLKEKTLTSVDGKPVHYDHIKTWHISPRLDEASSVAKKLYELVGQPVSLPGISVGESGWL